MADGMTIAGVHDPALVGLSFLIAVAASLTALGLAERIHHRRGRLRSIWIGATALALGGGIWSMHFVAMLAFSMPGMEVNYDLGLTVVSLILPIAVTGLGFLILDRKGTRHCGR